MIAYAEASPEVVSIAIQSGIEAVSITARRLTQEDALEVARLATSVAAQWVVLDGFRFTSEYRRVLHEAGLRVLQMDEPGFSDARYVDCVVNPTLHAHEDLYLCRQPSTHLLLGPQYIPLRKEFVKWIGWRRVTEASVRRVLLTFGGADDDNLTLRVLASLSTMSVRDLVVTAIIGPANPHGAAVQDFARSLSFDTHIIKSPPEIAEWMVWADIGVGAAGITTWEMACLGLPMVLTSVFHNEETVADTVEDAGAAVNVGWHEKVTCAQIALELERLFRSASRRARMSDCGRALVDGQGAPRILEFVRRQTL
jgi:spore coat polysaccharide biosynthesis predicted glycosyltransferase SpsG